MLEGRKEVPGREDCRSGEEGPVEGRVSNRRALRAEGGFAGDPWVLGRASPQLRAGIQWRPCRFISAAVTVSGRVLGTGDRCLRK